MPGARLRRRPKGTGSIRRERGRPGWCINGPRIDGKALRLGGGYATYREAERALDAFLARKVA
jgi:hypothetical protein